MANYGNDCLTTTLKIGLKISLSSVYTVTSYAVPMLARTFSCEVYLEISEMQQLAALIAPMLTLLRLLKFCHFCRRTLSYFVTLLLFTAELFYSFGFSCFAYVEQTTNLYVWSNPNQSNRRSAVQGYFLLWNKLVLSALA